MYFPSTTSINDTFDRFFFYSFFSIRLYIYLYKYSSFWFHGKKYSPGVTKQHTRDLYFSFVHAILVFVIHLFIQLRNHGVYCASYVDTACSKNQGFSYYLFVIHIFVATLKPWILNNCANTCIIIAGLFSMVKIYGFLVRSEQHVCLLLAIENTRDERARNSDKKMRGSLIRKKMINKMVLLVTKLSLMNRNGEETKRLFWEWFKDFGGFSTKLVKFFNYN